MEKWKKIDGYERYSVSNMGRVRYSLVHGGYSYRKPQINKKGYARVSIGGKLHRLHRVVAKAFVEGMSEVRCDVNHLDGNKLNNHAENLRWVSNHENNYHSITILGHDNSIPMVAYNNLGEAVAEFVSKSQAIKFKIPEKRMLPKSEYSKEAALMKLNKPRKKAEYKTKRVVGDNDFSKTCDTVIANRVLMDLRNGKSKKDISIEYDLNYYKISMIEKYGRNLK